MATKKPDLAAAHKHCFKSRKEALASEICGCFYCLATFPPGEIEEWTDDKMGSASGFSVDKEFLRLMNERWFS